MPVRPGFYEVASGPSGMQKPVRRPPGRARADPVFVGGFIPVAVDNLAAVIPRSAGCGAFRLMISPLFYGGKFPAAIGAAEFVGCWIYCRHSSFRGLAAFLVLVRSLQLARILQVALPLMRLNRLINDFPSFGEIRLFRLARIVCFR